MTDFKIEKFPFNQTEVNDFGKGQPEGINWPVVYTLSDNQNIYVGETLNASNRLSQHLANPRKAELEQVQIILHSRFNKSVCLDLESHLIRYFAADGKHRVLNANAGIAEANYFEREKYRESFNELFEQLVTDGLLSRPIPEILNSNLFKFSPFKALTNEQAIAVNGIAEAILESVSKSKQNRIVIEGDPGTGKTIVAIYLAKLLKDLAETSPDEIAESDSIFSELFTEETRQITQQLKIGLVVPQQSLRKTLLDVFGQTPGLDKSMIMTPFEVAESAEYFDLLIVDESHRLGRRANQSSAVGNKRFKDANIRLFGSDDYQYSQLDWIESKSKIQVLLLDIAQTVRPADLPKELTREIVDDAAHRGQLFRLTSQMRVSGGRSYLDFVNNLFSKTPIRTDLTGEYDVRFFENLVEMKNEILRLNREFQLCRMLAGFAWPWLSKKDPSAFDIEIQGLQLRWNQAERDWVNSPTSHLEVGSIHTIQGYDLNYAGVIIGNELRYDDEKQEIVFVRENYFDVKGKENNDKLGLKFTDEDVRDWVFNIYRVLLTRGIKGTYIYVCDKKLRHYLRQFFTNTSSK
jgi:DUF2075 family protein